MSVSLRRAAPAAVTDVNVKHDHSLQLHQVHLSSTWLELLLQSLLRGDIITHLLEVVPEMLQDLAEGLCGCGRALRKFVQHLKQFHSFLKVS